MSIPRYSINPLWWNIPLMDDHNGKLCEYRDYAKLEVENARLKALTAEMDKTINASQAGCRDLKAEVERLEAFCTRTIIPNKELQAQVERLTKAGDELRDSLPYIVDERLEDKTLRKIMNKWNAAKEGKPTP